MMKKKVISVLVSISLVIGGVIGANADSIMTNVQAVLSPDITIKYNAVKQEMKDANGNVVYPLVYNGTTYLPVRAVSSMVNLPVEWDAASRTVSLGSTEKQPKSLFDAVTSSKSTSYSNAEGFYKTVDTTYFKQPVDDFGNKLEDKYTYGYVSAKMSNIATWDGSYFEQRVSNLSLTLDDSYKTLKGTLYVNTALKEERIAFRVYDTKNNITLVEKVLNAGEVIDIEVELNGVKNIRLDARIKGSSSAYSYWTNCLAFMNPTVE